MRRLKQQGLQADLAALEGLLQSAQEMGDPVGEIQLTKRKERVQVELKSLIDTPESNASVALFFGGKPVLGSRGISTKFASHMLDHFQTLISSSSASAEFGVLGERGPIPGEQATDLKVTSLTRGSFGFVLDEIKDQTSFVDTSLKSTVDEVVTLLERVSSASETDFEEAAVKIDRRTLTSLKHFFVELDAAEATVRLVDDHADISLDASAIRRARQRTETLSIDESDVTVEGVLTGFLPEHRKFEMRVGGVEMLYGSVTKDAAKQYSEIVSRGQNPERQPWQVRIKKRMVTPLNGPARQTNFLLEFLACVMPDNALQPTRSASGGSGA